MSKNTKLPDLTDWNEAKDRDMSEKCTEIKIKFASSDLKGDMATKLIKHDWELFKTAYNDITASFIMPQDAETAKEYVQKLFEEQRNVYQWLMTAEVNIILYRMGRAKTRGEQLAKQNRLDRDALARERDCQELDFEALQKLASLIDLKNGVLNDDKDEDLSYAPATPNKLVLPQLSHMLNLQDDEVFAAAIKLADSPYYPALTVDEEIIVETSRTIIEQTKKRHVLLIPLSAIPTKADKFDSELHDLLKKNAAQYYFETISDGFGRNIIFNGDRCGAEKALEFKRRFSLQLIGGYIPVFSFFPSDSLRAQQKEKALKDQKKIRDGEL